MCRNQVFLIFASNAKSEQNKVTFSKKYSSRLELVKVFNFTDKIPGFHGNSTALSTFLHGILHYLISIVK